MSYIGKPYIIPCDRGGLSANPNIDTTPSVQMIQPSRNLNLNEMSRTPRGGTSIVDTLIDSNATWGDDFSTDLSSWTIESGTPTIESGLLKMVSDSSDIVAFNETTGTGDFTLDVKITVAELDNPFAIDYGAGTLQAVGDNVDLRMSFRLYGDDSSIAIGTGDLTNNSGDLEQFYGWVRIKRNGTSVKTYYSKNGSTWTWLETITSAAEDLTVKLYSNGSHLLSSATDVYFDDFTNAEGSVYAGAEIRGVYDFTTKGGTQYIVSADSTGDLYKDDRNFIATNMSQNNFFSFATFDDAMFVVDGYSVPKTWDGSESSASDITSPAADWSGTTQPSQLVVHGRGLSERLWAIMAGTSEYNNCVYASEDADGNDFSDPVKFEIQTDDAFGIVGAVEFGDRLICFGKRKAYIIDDSDNDTANWGYAAAQWEGGVAHWRLIAKTPNDIICMMENGEIYSVTAAENYGDYKAGSLIRPAYIHKWIANNIDLSQINKFHAIYEPKIRALKFFMVRNGQSQVDTALCYFIDRDPKEAWMVHDNQDSSSGYSAACAVLVRKSIGNYGVYTGDYSGRIWELETVEKNDNSNGFYAGFRTPAMDCDNPRATKNFKRLWLSVKPTGGWDMEVKWWVDGKNLTETSIDLTPDAGLGTFVLGTDILGGLEVKDVVVDLGANGRRVQFECYNSTADEKFFVNQIMLDYRELGNEPR